MHIVLKLLEGYSFLTYKVVDVIDIFPDVVAKLKLFWLFWIFSHAYIWVLLLHVLRFIKMSSLYTLFTSTVIVDSSVNNYVVWW